MFKILSILVMIVVCLPNYASATDSIYREEIMRNVIDPCYTEVVRRTPSRMTNEIGVHNMVKVFKMWFESMTESTISIITDAINEENLDAGKRNQFYSLFKQHCIDTMAESPGLGNTWPHYPFPKQESK